MIAVAKVVSRCPYSGHFGAHQFQRLRQSSLQVWTSAHLAFSRQLCRFTVTYEQRYLFLSASGLTRCCHVTARISNDHSYVAWLSRGSATGTFITSLGGESCLTERSRTYAYTNLQNTTCIVAFTGITQTSEGRFLICLVSATTASRQSV